MDLTKLFDLADAVNNSASNEGSEADLMVVEATPLWDLLQAIRLLKKAFQESLPRDAKEISDRLLDSEEHSGESAIPEVAEDAAEMISRLSTALLATQSTLSMAMQRAEKPGEFVEQVASLSIWDYAQPDGSSYKECERPSEGHVDSHCSLMELIVQARAIQQMT